MKNPPTHRNDADLQITIFSHDRRIREVVSILLFRVLYAYVVRGGNADLRSASCVRFGPIGSGVHFYGQATAEIGGLSHFSFD